MKTNGKSSMEYIYLFIYLIKYQHVRITNSIVENILCDSTSNNYKFINIINLVTLNWFSFFHLEHPLRFTEAH